MPDPNDKVTEQFDDSVVRSAMFVYSLAGVVKARINTNYVKDRRRSW